MTNPTTTTDPTTVAPVGTGSRATRVLGVAALLLGAATLAFGLAFSPPEITQEESARILYVHVPAAMMSLYVAFGITALGSVIHLRNGSRFWDLLAGASAEVGVVYLGLTLVTGMLWGKPTWGAYWTWDPRLTSTAVSMILYIGYLVVRRLEMDPVARSRRAAVIGIVSFANTIIVKYSVEWWRSLHQGSTLDPTDLQIEGLMYFSWFVGTMFALATFAWLVMHRFRLAWMEEQLEAAGLDAAIADRRNEGGAGGAAGLQPGGA